MSTTPCMMRRVMIWEMGKPSPLYEHAQQWKAQDDKEPSNGRSRIEKDGRHGDEASDGKDADGGQAARRRS